LGVGVAMPVAVTMSGALAGKQIVKVATRH
jgi:hypothetical protein